MRQAPAKLRSNDTANYRNCDMVKQTYVFNSSSLIREVTTLGRNDSRMREYMTMVPNLS